MNMKKLHTYVLKYWPAYLLALVSMFIATGLDMVYPQITKIMAELKDKDFEFSDGILTVEQALEEGLSPQNILEEGLMDGMNIIGQKFKDNEVFVPEVLVSARAMNMGMEALKPYLLQENAKPAGKVVIGTVKGDLHDIGKNLVKLMMESKGFEVIDAGVDVSAEQFVEKAIETEANIISCSALLTTTMLEMRRVVEVAEEKGVRNRIKIIIGGAPVTQKFCDEIGADGYATDAVSAAELALELVK